MMRWGTPETEPRGEEEPSVARDTRMSARGEATGDAVPSSSTRTRASDRNQWYLQGSAAIGGGGKEAAKR